MRFWAFEISSEHQHVFLLLASTIDPPFGRVRETSFESSPCFCSVLPYATSLVPTAELTPGLNMDRSFFDSFLPTSPSLSRDRADVKFFRNADPPSSKIVTTRRLLPSFQILLWPPHTLTKSSPPCYLSFFFFQDERSFPIPLYAKPLTRVAPNYRTLLPTRLHFPFSFLFLQRAQENGILTLNQDAPPPLNSKRDLVSSSLFFDLVTLL